MSCAGEVGNMYKMLTQQLIKTIILKVWPNHCVNKKFELNALKLIPAATIIYNIAITLVKVALLHFYVTIFGLNTAFRYVTYAVMALIVALGCDVLICRPLDKDWDPHLHGVCGSNDNGVLVGGILNVITDFTMITLPMPMIWRLQMAPQRKVALTVIFGLGFMYVLAPRERRINADGNPASAEYLSFELSLQHKSTKPKSASSLT